MRPSTAIAACMLVVGCKSDPPPPSAPLVSTQLAAPSHDAMASAIDAAPSSPVSTVVIRADRVGSITRQTTAKDLDGLFPQFERGSEVRRDFIAKRDLEHVWFARGGQHVLTVVMDPRRTRSPIVEVNVGDPAASTEAGARPGHTIAEVARIYPDLACNLSRVKPTQNMELISLSCATASLPHVTFSPAAKAGQLAGPIEIDTIRDDIVQVIVWKPSSS